MALLDDLKVAQAAVAEAESTKGVVDSLIELGEGALGYVELAREQVKEQAPELAAKAEEVVAASKRHLPKAAAAVGAVLVAGAIVGGVVLWQRRSGTELEVAEDLAVDIAEPTEFVEAVEVDVEASDDVEDAIAEVAEEAEAALESDDK